MIKVAPEEGVVLISDVLIKSWSLLVYIMINEIENVDRELLFSLSYKAKVVPFNEIEWQEIQNR